MDEIEVIRGKLSRAYESIQNLTMQPTKTNMEIVLAAMGAMKDAYDFLGKIDKPADDEHDEAMADAISEDAPGEPEADDRVSE